MLHTVAMAGVVVAQYYDLDDNQRMRGAFWTLFVLCGVALVILFMIKVSRGMDTLISPPKGRTHSHATPATPVETCANCGQAIGKLEIPAVWQEHTVCTACYLRLSSQ